MMYSQLVGAPQKQETYVEGPLGIKLSAVAWGFPHAPHHLLLVHGGYQTKETFREQYEALATADCYVVGFDLPWHGQSGPEREESHLVPTLPLLAESLTAVRQHFHLSDSVVILAWSLGGLIVREYLSGQAPPAASGLVFVAPLLDMGEGMVAWQKYSPNTRTLVEELEQENNFSAQAFLRFVEMLSAHKTPDYLTLGYNSLSFLNAGTHFSRMLAGHQAGNVEAFLGSISCPVLFVQGTLDELLPAAYTRHNAARVPEGQVTLLELPCGHSPHLEQPFLFNAALRQFLNSLSQGKTAPLMHPGGNGL